MSTNPSNFDAEPDPIREPKVSSQESLPLDANGEPLTGKVAEDSQDCTEAVDYVNQLIARMNGLEDQEEPMATPEVMLTEPIMTAPQEPANVESVPPTTTVRPEPRPASVHPTEPISSVTPVAAPAESRKPHRPVVMAADMERLREAANISMSGALNSHETRSLYRMILAYLVLASGLILTSLLLVTMAGAANEMAYYSAVIASLVAALATWKYMRSTKRLVEVVHHQSKHTLPDIPAL